MPSAPLVPTFAVDIKLLDLYISLNKFHRRLGLQPFIRAIHDYHDQVLLSASAHTFSRAYDCYQSILRSINIIIDTTLGRNSQDYRIKHACAPCMYRTTNEPTLPYSLLLAADGNMSLRRFQKVGASNPAVFESDYFVSRQDVDQFAHVAQVRHKKDDVLSENIQDAEVEHATVPEKAIDNIGGALTGEDPLAETFGNLTVDCVERWKANSDDKKKVMWDCFEECGIFTTVCRHGVVLFACDIVKSGEL